ncbi:MAG: helix-turn-helix domain-containing protein [Firmicutes bacterium]|nr:helix-turn-helix domain-containing protein [Bacillota bacterium]
MLSNDLQYKSSFQTNNILCYNARMNIFAQRLVELRTQSDFSQRDLSKEISIPQSTIANWESGRFEPSFDTLIKIADYFDVTTDYLLGREGFDI